jgi:polar amino acid transport system substrate-binding protein
MRKVVGMLSLAGAFIAALATSGYAGQTLDRVMKNKMLVEVTDQAYPPFSFVNDKGEVEGFDIDIAKEFAKRLGVGLKVETPSWEIIVAGNWHGRWDICICSMTATKERSKFSISSISTMRRLPQSRSTRTTTRSSQRPI